MDEQEYRFYSLVLLAASTCIAGVVTLKKTAKCVNACVMSVNETRPTVFRRA